VYKDSKYAAEGGLKVAKDEQMQADGLYTLGKEYAFEWISTHPNASIEELIDELKKCKPAWRIKSPLFNATVRKIAKRVMLVTGKSCVETREENDLMLIHIDPSYPLGKAPITMKASFQERAITDFLAHWQIRPSEKGEYEFNCAISYTLKDSPHVFDTTKVKIIRDQLLLYQGENGREDKIVIKQTEKLKQKCFHIAFSSYFQDVIFGEDTCFYLEIRGKIHGVWTRYTVRITPLSLSDT
jgi:hypothetical protein